MLMVGATGTSRSARDAATNTAALLAAHGGLSIPGSSARPRLGARRASAAPYLRNALWEHGYAVDTVETATDWTRLPATLAAIEAALRTDSTDRGERVVAFHPPVARLSRRAPASTRPTSSGSPPTRPRRCAAGRRSRTAVEPSRSSRTAARSATSTASASTTGPTWKPRRARSGCALLRGVAAELDPDGIAQPRQARLLGVRMWRGGWRETAW